MHFGSLDSNPGSHHDPRGFVMGVEEIAVFTAGMQFSQAAVAYLKKIQSAATSPYAKPAVAVGLQFFNNAIAAFQAGLAAATAEFNTTQGAESTVVSQLQALPPIT
jgi:hypothetical protein